MELDSWYPSLCKECREESKVESPKSVSDVLHDMGMPNSPLEDINISYAMLKLKEAKDTKNEYAYYFWHRIINRLEENKTPIGEEQK